jgi:predicted CopG family antitoxin
VTPPGTALRNIRISDELWLSALAKAEEQQTSVSEVIRHFLQQWVDS